MTEFVIHADDFGLNEQVNACIDTCFMRHMLSETSLMVNMPYCDEAVALARRRGYASFVGFHLNLTYGLPLTEEIRSCPRFCGADGMFNYYFHATMKRRLYMTGKERRAVEAEIRAQVEKFCSYEGLMMKVDSHHHSHMDYLVYRLLKPIALEHGFTAMRIFTDLHRVRLDKEIYGRFFTWDVRRHFQTTDHFDGVNERLLMGPGGVTEVMVHPVLKDGVLCDSAVPYERHFEQVKAVPDATIRLPSL